MSEQALCSGDIAPDFRLLDYSGESVHLYETLERSAVVLFFYLKAFTPVCMAEACAFRDNVDGFRELNATVIGISSDGKAAAKRFANYHRLSFPLLLDKGNNVRKLYRVPRMLGVLPGRSTFVIGQDCKLLNVTHADFDGSPHVVESLRSLRGAVAE